MILLTEDQVFQAASVCRTCTRGLLHKRDAATRAGGIPQGSGWTGDVPARVRQQNRSAEKAIRSLVKNFNNHEPAAINAINGHRTQVIAIITGGGITDP